MTQTANINLITPAGAQHAEVYFISAGPDRGHWRAVCHLCDWRTDPEMLPGDAVNEAFHHGLNAHDNEGPQTSRWGGYGIEAPS